MRTVRLPTTVAKRIYLGAALLGGEKGIPSRIRAHQRFERAPLDAIHKHQRRRLASIVLYALTSSPHYRGILDPDLPKFISHSLSGLQEIPILTKEDLQQRFAELRSVASPRRVSLKTTGGSTGQPVTVAKDRDATANERAAMWCAYGWHGIEIGDPGIRFWGTARESRRSPSHNAVTDFCMNRMRLSAFAFSEDHLEAYWRKIVLFRPAYFHGYVSMLDEFARYVAERGYSGESLGLKAIIATSEVITDSARDRIEGVFRAPVRGEYGSGEIGSIAFECDHGKYHVMAQNAVVEVLRPDGTQAGRGERGELVITDLNNRAMPLLRYRIGDFGTHGEPCGCGRTLPTLDSILGRAYDFVQAPDGLRYHGEYFMYFFEDLRTAGFDVGQFQVTQESASEITIKVVTRADFDLIRGAILERIQPRLSSMHVSITQVPAIPRASSGKMQVIQQRAAT
jgi:phenylacetate-CoA ligase